MLYTSATTTSPRGAVAMSGGVSESKRNWPEYNEFLVRRGELYLTFTFLENWDADLDEINRDKLGRKFESPPSFIQFLMMVHVIFNLPYRRWKGFSESSRISFLRFGLPIIQLSGVVELSWTLNWSIR